MKRILSWILCFIMLCSMPAMSVHATERVTPSGVDFEAIGKRIESMAERNKDYFASFATAVFQGEQVLYEGYFGYIDRENQTLAAENNVYEWGSISKLLVWVSVLQLYEQGKIDLNADIRDYLPEDFFQKLKYEDSITMLHLMNHNAGWEETSMPIYAEKEEDILSLEEALRSIEPAQTFRPGDITAYSNWGTALAGLIVERISGMDYAQYVRENILEPLGMEHTAVSADYRDNEWVRTQREKEKSYLILGDKEQGIVTDEDLGTAINYIQIYPAGSVTGTLEDMTKFAQAFLNEECPLFEQQETLDFMLSASDFYGDSDIPKNCHGLWCSEYAVRTMGHGGNTIGGSANLVFDRESKVGVVVLTNQQAESLFCYGIPELILGSIEENPIYKNATITTQRDVSGDYVMSRGVFEGARKISPCLTYTPVRASKDAKVFTVLDEPMLVQFGDNLYRMEGTNDFVYVTTTSEGELALEYSMMTLLRNEAVAGESGAVTIFAGIVVASLILLLVISVKKVLKIGEKMPAGKWVLAGLIAASVMGLLLFAITIEVESMAIIKAVNVVIGCSMLIGILVCLLAAVITLKTVILEKKMKLTNRMKYVAYALCNLYVVGFMVYFRVFDFWT